jgi:hypothetical protein
MYGKPQIEADRARCLRCRRPVSITPGGVRWLMREPNILAVTGLCTGVWTEHQRRRDFRTYRHNLSRQTPILCLSRDYEPVSFESIHSQERLGSACTTGCD